MALKNHAFVPRGLKLVDLHLYAPFYVFVLTVTYIIVRVFYEVSISSVASRVTEAER